MRERNNAHYSIDGLWYTCWLIERRDRGDPQWWDSGGWTKKAHNATWFARQCDAENLLMLNRHWGEPTAVMVCEHAFMLEKPVDPTAK